MTELADKKCVPCRGGVPPLKGKELDALHKIVPQWSVVEQHHITRAFTFPDFKQALDFVNRVGALAEEQGHHPDILLALGQSARSLSGRTRSTASPRAISSWPPRSTG